MAINIGKNADGDVTYQNPPVNRTLFPNIKYGATPEEIQEAVDAWLDDHPEATTTVEDGSILPVKLDSTNDATDGYVLSYNATAGKFEWYNIGGELDEINSDITDLRQEFNKNCFTNTMDLSKESVWYAGNINSLAQDGTIAGHFRTTYYIDITNYSNSLNIVIDGAYTVFLFQYDENKNIIWQNSAHDIAYIKFDNSNVVKLNASAKYIRLDVRCNPIDSSATIDIVEHIGVFGSINTIASIEKIKDGLNGHQVILADDTDLTIYGYIVGDSGAHHVSENYSWVHTDYINVSGHKKITLPISTFTSNSTKSGLGFYDAEKTFISGYVFPVTGTAGFTIRTITVPDNAVYLRTGMRVSQKDYFVVRVDDILYLQDAIDKSGINTYGMQMFQKIGVIGDSISCGLAKDKNGNNSRRNTGISWVQQMARRLGCTAYNLGASGVDPVEWFQNNYEFAEYCYTQYLSVGACDLYIVGLGLNQATLGMISDINENDYTQNGETFYGQYARIIQMINAEHPDAIVMCLTEPTTNISSYDQAVRNICSLQYIKAELVDLENDYFDLFNTPEILAEHQPDNLHFTPYGYSLLADAMVIALSDYIAKHSSAFKYVGVAEVS